MSNIILPYTALSREFYQRDTTLVAQALIGKLLVHDNNGVRVSGIIIETESYGAHNDPASHAFRSQTLRNSPMFGPVGHSYVYFTYGKHFCVNITAKADHMPAGAVLIRALIPYEGIEHMRKRRVIASDKLLTNGPGKLTQALGITKEHNNRQLIDLETLWIAEGISIDPATIIHTPRIGISTGKELLWRFYLPPDNLISIR